MHDAFAGLLFQLVPKGLRAQHQRNIAFAFAVGVTDQPRFAVMRALGMGRMAGIDHQHRQARLGGVKACGGANGPAAHHNQIINH